MTPQFENIFLFLWEVENDGYEWVDGRAKIGSLLIGRGGIGSPITRYKPLERFPGLFLEFAKLKPTRDSIRAFADRYGPLFGTYDIESVVFRHGRGEGGSTLSEWKREIEHMDAIVRLWNAIKANDMVALRKVVGWNDNGVRYLITTRGSRWGRSIAQKTDPDFDSKIVRFKNRKVLGPARYALMHEINKQIATATTVPRLVWAPAEDRYSGTSKPDDHMRIIFTPSSLLAAMWLQFAQVVTAEYRLRRCVGCGEYFQIGPGGKRTDADTCGPKCRQRKKRQKDSF